MFAFNKDFKPLRVKKWTLHFFGWNGQLRWKKVGFDGVFFRDRENCQPLMCAYKLVTINFSLWGLRHKVEQMLHDVIRSIYHQTHQQAFCWVDEWIEKSFDQIRLFDIKMEMPNKMIGEQQKTMNDEISNNQQKENKSTKEKLGQFGSKLISKL